MHSGAKVSSMSFRNAGNQIGGPSQSERGRKATDEDHGDFSFQPEWLESLVNWVLVRSLSRDADVPADRITGSRDFALAQRMADSHNTDETVYE